MWMHHICSEHTNCQKDLELHQNIHRLTYWILNWILKVKVGVGSWG
jgi:hypothetical protein